MTWEDWDKRFRVRLDQVIETTDSLRRVIEHRLSSASEIADAIEAHGAANRAMSTFLRDEPPVARRGAGDPD